MSERRRRRPPDPQRRMLIPDLWTWGHKPVMSGNQKAGKTTLVTHELVPSLVVPGWRLFDHFPPAQVGTDLGRGLWVVNAETPAQDFDAALEPVLDLLVDVHSDDGS
jgi:hypothetical protein